MNDNIIPQSQKLFNIRSKEPEEECSLCHQTYPDEYEYQDWGGYYYKKNIFPLFVLEAFNLLICRECFLRFLATVSSQFGRADILQAIFKIAPHYVGRSRTSQMLRAKVLERDGYKCLRCGGGEKLEADHIIPDMEGGETTLENLQTLCRPCNRWKGVKTIDFRTNKKANVS